MNGTTLTVPINAGSDGDSTHRPAGPNYRLVNPPSIYLEKLATAWVQHRGTALQPGVRYILDKLPDGYAVYERPRPGNPKVIDKWCFGHPKHKWFDSPNRFLPHFLHLMDNGNSNGCDCAICSKPGAGSRQIGRPKGATSVPSTSNMAAAAFRHKGRNWIEGKADDEGSPDVYRNLIEKLKSSGTLDTRITETMSMDWRAEREHLTLWLKKLSIQPAWIPRNGELILFIRTLPQDQEIRLDEETNWFNIWDSTSGRFTGFPPWEAGVVTQTPTENVHFEDLVTNTQKEYSVTYSGFRVEPLPDPNNDDKPFSKQYKYVRLNQMRPMVFWSELLSGSKKKDWHPTVQHSATAAATIALVEKYYFKGKWPIAKISCRGMYIGPEFVKEGDIVRVLPLNDNDNSVTDILNITAITLDLSKLDTASSDDYDDGHPYNLTIYVTGKMYSLDKAKAVSPETVDLDLLPEDYDLYGKWFYTHEPNKSCRIPFYRVLGRCFEPAAMRLWFPRGNIPPNISAGLKGMRASRLYSAQINRRIVDGKKWYWADCRVEALDLHEVNGYEVASRDSERDPKAWRKEIRVMEGTARPEEIIAMQAPENLQTPRGSQTGMFKSAIDLVSGENGRGPSTEGSRDRKRSRSALGRSESDDDDELVERDRFVAQMAQGIGLPMDDELISDEDDEDDILDDTPRGRRLEVVIE